MSVPELRAELAAAPRRAPRNRNRSPGFPRASRRILKAAPLFFLIKAHFSPALVNATLCVQFETARGVFTSMCRMPRSDLSLLLQEVGRTTLRCRRSTAPS